MNKEQLREEFRKWNFPRINTSEGTMDYVADWWLKKLDAQKEAFEGLEEDYLAEIASLESKKGEQWRKGFQTAYDEGAAEATKVCNEKTIPLAIEKVKKEIVDELEKAKLNFEVQDFVSALDKIINS